MNRFIFRSIIFCCNVIFLTSLFTGCSSIKTLKRSNNTPELHDNYDMDIDERMYAVLPLPDAFDKDDWVEFYILEYPKKGSISLIDRYKGFFYYTPREGAFGYDFFVYNVSDGKKVVKKIIQFNIDRDK